MDSSESNWKSITYVIGAVLGLAMGVTAAHMYTRAAEEHGQTGLPAKVDTGEVLRIGLAVLALIRQVSALGAKSLDNTR